MTRLSDVNEGINQALEGSARGFLGGQLAIAKPAVTRDCPNSGRDLSANSSAAIKDVAGVPHSQELLPGAAAGKDSGVGPLANPQVTAKGIPGYLPSSPNRPAGILDVADLAAGNAPVKDSPLVGSNSGVSTSARVDAPEASNSLAVFLGGIDALIQQVEGVLLRHRVTETGLAEVGQ